LSNIIEHSDNGNTSERVIRVGDNTPISMKTYQDCYHQITGKTEQIKKRYQDDLLIDFSALEQLNNKIMQLCEVHNIIANNEVISVFHEKERKEQFTSFERFKIYNSNSVSPTVSAVIKYNFSIIPPNLQYRGTTTIPSFLGHKRLGTNIYHVQKNEHYFGTNCYAPKKLDFGGFRAVFSTNKLIYKIKIPNL
jgi:hypothetical protein